MSNKSLSDFFLGDKEALTDHNRTNHVTRCHRRRTDTREGLVAILIAGAFMGLYVAAQAWTKADVDQRFLSREVGR